MLTCDEYLTPVSLDEAFDAMHARRGRYRLPATPEKVLAAIREKEGRETAALAAE